MLFFTMLLAINTGCNLCRWRDVFFICVFLFFVIFLNNFLHRESLSIKELFYEKQRVCLTSYKAVKIKFKGDELYVSLLISQNNHVLRIVPVCSKQPRFFLLSKYSGSKSWDHNKILMNHCGIFHANARFLPQRHFFFHSSDNYPRWMRPANHGKLVSFLRARDSVDRVSCFIQ